MRVLAKPALIVAVAVIILLTGLLVPVYGAVDDSGAHDGAIPAGDFGEFVAFCDFSHRASDDPIVFPGEPGRSHSHDFFGSTVVDADTTLDELAAGTTTCDPAADRSAYWVPTLYDGDGEPVPVENGTFYYLVHVDEPASVQPYPPGLMVIAGNPRATGPDEAEQIKWSCLGSAVSSTGAIVECPAESRLELLLNFPDCWDGERLDSADHMSHMAYSEGGECPASHPVVVPSLQFKLRYATRGGVGFSLASGPGYTAHGDFINAWEPDALANRIHCLHHLVKCGPEGFPHDAAADPSHQLFLPLLDR